MQVNLADGERGEGAPGMPGMPGMLGGMPGMPGGMPGMPGGVPGGMDPQKYMEAVQRVMGNPQFMNMAEKLGREIMQVRRCACECPNGGVVRQLDQGS